MALGLHVKDGEFKIACPNCKGPVAIVATSKPDKYVMALSLNCTPCKANYAFQSRLMRAFDSPNKIEMGFDQI